MFKIIKNNAKRMVTLLIILSVLSLNLPIISFAEGDNETPGLDISSITISNKNATVGEKVKISFRINNISGDIKYVEAYYNRPVVNTMTDKFSFEYNIQNGLFEHEFEVTDTWVNGEYLFNRLMISIGNYGETYYNSENENINNFGQIINLNAFNFTIYGTTGDNTPPAIVSSSLDISDNKAVIGDTITYKVKVLENTSIKNVNIKLANETGRYEYTYKTLNMSYNSTSQLYEARLTVDDSLLSGYWYVNNIYAVDTFNNNYTLYNTQFYSSGTFTANRGYANLAKATFKNFQEYPNAKLIDNAITVENANVTVDDNLKISMTICDDYGIDNVKLFYNQETDTNNQIVLQPIFEKTKYTSGSSYGNVTFFKTTTDIYTLNKKIEKYGCNSSWILDRIEVENTAGHITTFYNKQAYPYSLTDLSSGNFTTYGLTENSVEIEQENISLDDNKKMQQIECNVVLNGIPNKPVKFTSNDESVAIVSPTGLITAQGNGNATITISSEDNTISKDITVNVNMNENNAAISSSLECSGNENDITTIQLINNNEEVFKLELTGNTKEFTVPSIEQGEYILRISKDNHVTREYSITADNSNIDLDTKICLIGDSNNDGKVNGKDWNRLYEHINETNEITDYELLCADVNKDGKVNGKDWNRLYEHITEVNPLF